MPFNLPPAETREVITSHVARLKGLPTFREPTEEDYDLHVQEQAFARTQLHQNNRGKRQISVDLGLVMKDFEALFIGKSVLDVGCGTGVLSEELARLKRTKVTALDHDPEMLSQVRETKNLKAVLGSGFNIKEAVGDEKFDVIISSFSSYYWAKNAQERRASIMSPLGSCIVGGKVIFVPVIAEPGAREWNRKLLSSSSALHSEKLDEGLLRRRRARAAILVKDWLDVISIEILLTEEARGAIDCTFLSSRDNAKNIFIPDTDATVERYSVIAKVLRIPQFY